MGRSPQLCVQVLVPDAVQVQAGQPEIVQPPLPGQFTEQPPAEQFTVSAPLPLFVAVQFPLVHSRVTAPLLLLTTEQWPPGQVKSQAALPSHSKLHEPAPQLRVQLSRQVQVEPDVQSLPPA